MPWLADTQAIALTTGRTPATIRSWALRYPHLMPRQGTDRPRGRGQPRALYDVEAAEYIAWCLTNGISPKLATLADLRNTERVRGSLPGNGRQPLMDPADLHSVTFPAGAVLPGAFHLIDGAVAELQPHEDGSVTAEIRIPARCEHSLVPPGAIGTYAAGRCVRCGQFPAPAVP